MTHDYRIVPCEACGTEGRIYERHQGYCRHTGYYEGEVDTGPCPYCEGTGGEIIEVQMVEMDELEFAA